MLLVGGLCYNIVTARDTDKNKSPKPNLNLERGEQKWRLLLARSPWRIRWKASISRSMVFATNIARMLKQ